MTFAGPYADLYRQNGAANGIDGNLVAAIAWRESGHNPAAVGDGGCSCGLMQLNWCGGAGFGYTCAQLQDLATNVGIGAAYLAECLRAFPGDTYRGVAAYRQGIYGVQVNGPINEGNYITDILAKWAEYGGGQPPVPNPSPVPSLTTDQAIALLIVAVAVAFALG